MSLALRSICVAAALSACGGHTLDVGSTDGGPSAHADPGQDGATGLTGPVWNGVLENAQFSNGSNRLKMTFSVASDGAAIGTMLLGDGALLQPPTDPNVGYPPGVMFPTAGPLGFFEGFPYTMLGGKRSGATLTFVLGEYELWKQWCSMQKSYIEAHDTDGAALYSCTPSYAGPGLEGDASCTINVTNPTTNESVPVECGKAELCSNIPCECSATACRVRDWMHPQVVDELAGEPDLSFDLSINGATADGTMSGELGDHPVHFVRAP
jgi:hypothetical protein